MSGESLSPGRAGLSGGWDPGAIIFLFSRDVAGSSGGRQAGGGATVLLLSGPQAPLTTSESPPPICKGCLAMGRPLALKRALRFDVFLFTLVGSEQVFVTQIVMF